MHLAWDVDPKSLVGSELRGQVRFDILPVDAHFCFEDPPGLILNPEAPECRHFLTWASSDECRPPLLDVFDDPNRNARDTIGLAKCELDLLPFPDLQVHQREKGMVDRARHRTQVVAGAFV